MKGKNKESSIICLSKYREKKLAKGGLKKPSASSHLKKRGDIVFMADYLKSKKTSVFTEHFEEELFPPQTDELQKQSKKTGNLISLDDYRKKKRQWKKQFASYSKELAQVAAMSFVFLFSFSLLQNVKDTRFTGEKVAQVSLPLSSIKKQDNKSSPFVGESFGTRSLASAKKLDKPQKDYTQILKNTKNAITARPLAGSKYQGF